MLPSNQQGAHSSEEMQVRILVHQKREENLLVRAWGTSLALPQVVKTLHCPFHGIIHGDQWPVPEELFCFLTTVVVERTGQCHTHWCKSWLNLDERTDHHHQ